MDEKTILCPSSKCEDGVILLGIVMPDGRVAFSQDRIVVNSEFVSIAHEGRSPEKRFRFSGKCVKWACKQWTGDRCGVIDVVINELGPVTPSELPQCSIRPECRWYQQRGALACAVCPEVITDLTSAVEEWKPLKIDGLSQAQL